MFLIPLFLLFLFPLFQLSSQTVIPQTLPLLIINNPISTFNTIPQQNRPIYIVPPVNAVSNNLVYPIIATTSTQSNQLVIPQMFYFLNTIPNQQIHPLFSTVNNFNQNIKNNQLNTPVAITQTHFTQGQNNSNYYTDLNTFESNYIPQNIIRGIQPTTTFTPFGSLGVQSQSQFQSPQQPQILSQTQLSVQNQSQLQSISPTISPIQLTSNQQPFRASYIGNLSTVSVKQNITILQGWPGYWNMSECAGYATKFPVKITQQQVTFKFCNKNKYNYYLRPTNVVIQGGPIQRQRCQYWMPPQQIHIQTAVRSAIFWTLNSNTLILKNKDQKVVSILHRISFDTFVNGFVNE